MMLAILKQLIIWTSKYFIINFTMSKIMEMEQVERNNVTLFLFNNVKN